MWTAEEFTFALFCDMTSSSYLLGNFDSLLTWPEQSLLKDRKGLLWKVYGRIRCNFVRCFGTETSPADLWPRDCRSWAWLRESLKQLSVSNRDHAQVTVPRREWLHQHSCWRWIHKTSSQLIIQSRARGCAGVFAPVRARRVRKISKLYTPGTKEFVNLVRSWNNLGKMSCKLSSKFLASSCKTFS